jgi:hypothetical protein
MAEMALILPEHLAAAVEAVVVMVETADGVPSSPMTTMGGSGRSPQPEAPKVLVVQVEPLAALALQVQMALMEMTERRACPIFTKYRRDNGT